MAPEARVHWAGSGPQPRPLDRTGAGFHHLGDVTLRVRDAARKGDGWRTYSTVHRDELCGAGGKPAAARVGYAHISLILTDPHPY